MRPRVAGRPRAHPRADPADTAGATTRHRAGPTARGALLASCLFTSLCGQPTSAVPSRSALTFDDAQELHLDGELAAADAAYTRLLADPDQPLADHAASANNLCVLRLGQGRYAEAAPTCRQAVDLRRRQLALPVEVADDPDLPLRLARALNNLGLVLTYRGDPAAALVSYREALALNEAAGEVAAAAVNGANLGLALTAAGRYREALAAHRAVAERAARHADEDWAAQQAAIAWLNQGVVLERLGAYREALAALQEVDADALQPAERATLAVDLAVVLRNLGDPVRAAALLADAARQPAIAADRAALANVELNRGRVAWLGLGDAAAAGGHLRRAVALAQESGDSAELVQALFDLGRLRLAARDQGAQQEARELLERALVLARTAGLPEGEQSVLVALAELAQADGRPTDAIHHLDAALAIVEDLRGAIDPGPLRWRFYGDRRTTWATAVALTAPRPGEAWSPAAAERALGLTERARVRELLDALDHPEDVRRGGSRGLQPATAAEIQRGLRPGETLLVTFLGEDLLYGWAVTSDALVAAPPQAARPLLAATRRTHLALAAGSEPAATDLELLGDGLFAALHGQPRQPIHTLLVVADGPLRRLPFELLPWKVSPAEAAPALEHAAIAYVPSASVLLATRQRSNPASPSADHPGDGRQTATFRPAADRATRPTATLLALVAEAGAARDDQAGAPRGRLVGAATEVSAARTALGEPATVLAGGQATEARWRAATAVGARVVHIAAHTALDERPSGSGPAIELSPEAGDDGLLTPGEIARQPLVCALAVLAGCRTGQVEEIEGRALESLTGAFLAAGAPAVIASLWDVGDESTAIFMTQLYHHLGRGLPVGAALRETKRRFRADPRWRGESSWAAFVLLGDPTVQVATGRRGWLPLAALLAVAGALAAAAWTWFRRRPAR